jgi:DNA-binding response OmpR family regulator
MEIRILFVDDEDIVEELVQFFNDEKINKFTLKAFSENTFESGLDRIRTEKFDIIILDLCRGRASETADQEGLNILSDIQKSTFLPVVFHSAMAYKIRELKSLIVGISDKKNGIDELRAEIERVISSNTVLLKDRIHSLIEDEFKNYFWDVIHNKRDIFLPEMGDVSLNYLILRRLANSLSKHNIKKLVDDDRTSENVLPMEFYIYPTPLDKEFEAGDIVEYNAEHYILLTPDCDYVERFKKGVNVGRKAKKILMAKILKLNSFLQYKEHKADPKKSTVDNLKKIITNNQSEQYFFLPGTPFLENSVIDFQEKIMVDYISLDVNKRISKLDSPYAQSMITSFIRYYNRIGFPDIDSDYIINQL